VRANHPSANIRRTKVEEKCLLPSFEPKSRELNESAGVAGGVEPLEEAPKEADPEVLEESTDLLPGKSVKVKVQVFHYMV